MTVRMYAAALILAAIAVGCGANPVAPAPIQEPGSGGTPVLPAARVEIRDFRVLSGIQAATGLIWYAPKLTLVETSGVSRATTEWIRFELLDIGINGIVPIMTDRIEVPAGGAVTIGGEDDYGGVWPYITNRMTAPSVAVTVAYLDHSGLPGHVSAAVEVSR